MSPTNNDKPSFLDRGTIVSLIVIMLFWYGWSRYMEAKYPNRSAETAAPTTAASPSAAAEESLAIANSKATETGAEAGAPVVAPGAEEFLDYRNDIWGFRLSSKGMGLKEIDVKGYKTRSNEPIILGNVQGLYPFATTLIASGLPVDFKIEKTADDTFVGRASINGMQIQKTMKVDSSTYSIDTEVKVTGADADFKGLTILLTDKLMEGRQGSLFAPSYEHHSWFVVHEGTTTRSVIKREEGFESRHKNTRVAALTEHYFALAVVDHSDLLPNFETRIAANSELAKGQLAYRPVNAVGEFNVKYVGFAGPKSFEILSRIDDDLARVIDYGMFAIIARPLLWLLRFLHSIFGNWGWAIVGLTIIVRLLVMPFNMYSYKSMKVMQKIQPEMNQIRERYKDKPTEQKLQMNQEIMELMKRNKANPLGGCLPMLLQLPVFIALYAVLGQSIELYRAPFIFWITDLTAHDRFYVLPILMGITMFVQQKITPTTMDPQQAKVLMWMPVIFSVFMLSLPSGLTLYIFVSTLFGIIQQYVLMREKTSTATVKEAKA